MSGSSRATLKRSRSLNARSRGIEFPMIGRVRRVGGAVSQQPAAGDKVTKDSVIHLNVSRGAKPVQVPDVTNQPFANAKSALRSGRPCRLFSSPRTRSLTLLRLASSSAAKGSTVPPAPIRPSSKSFVVKALTSDLGSGIWPWP